MGTEQWRGSQGPCGTWLRAGLLPDYSLLSLYSLRQEQWMNVRVGDIIKLENNQFVAVSAALRQVWFQLGGWYTGTTEWCGATPTLLL